MKPKTFSLQPGTREMLHQMSATVRPLSRVAPDRAAEAARRLLAREPVPAWAYPSCLLFARNLGKLTATYSGGLLADRVKRLVSLWHVAGLELRELERVAMAVWDGLMGVSPGRGDEATRGGR